MAISKQAPVENFGFLSLSKKMFLYSSLIAFLLVLIGAAVAGISAIVVSGLGIGIGVAIVYFGKLWLACEFALYGITSREDTFVRAGLFVASGLILASL